MWRGKQSYIENKKEQEQPSPPIGLSHTSDETEVATGKIEAGSDFTHSTGTQNLPLSDDKGTKKSIIQTKRGKQRALRRVRAVR